MRGGAAAALLLAFAVPATAQSTIHVAAGGNLQTALNTAAPGDTITLAAGATFSSATGFTLPAKVGTGTITVRTDTADGNLPARVNPTTYAANPALFATVRSTHNAWPVITADAGDKNWTFIGIVFEMSNAVTNAVAEVLRLGEGIAVEADLPLNVTIDRCVVRAAAGGTAKRGIQAQVRNLIIRNSWFTNIQSAASESHAISTWNSPGPFLIEHNYIEAADIGVLFGGAVPAIANLIPSDITVRWNYITRDPALHNSTTWAVKNLFELKNARRAHIYGNIFEHNWPEGQAGFAVVFTVRANGPNAGWTTIRDVMFERNIVRKINSVFNILGLDSQVDPVNGGVYASTRMRNVTIRNNLIYELDRVDWNHPTGSNAGGIFVQVNGDPEYLTIEDNTAMGAGSITGNIISLGPAGGGFVFRRNIVQKYSVAGGLESYGVVGSGFGEGNAPLAQYAPNVSGFPNTVFGDNVLAGCTASVYSNWPTNVFPSLATLHADFTNVAADNFRLVQGSAFAGKGMNQDEVEAAIAGAAVPTPEWVQAPPVPAPTAPQRIRLRLGA